MASQYLHTSIHAKEVTVRKALYEYIELNRNVFSPSTIRGYDTLYRTAYEPILDTCITKLDKLTLQGWISEYGACRRAKTVRNAHALLSAACKLHNYTLPEVNLPAKQKVKYNVPSDKEVQQIIAYFKSIDRPDMALATMLGAYGQMRRGEVIALTSEDFVGNICHISKDIVQNDKKEWVEKPPKTLTSDRYITLPDFVIAELPKKKGKLFDLTPEQLTNTFNQALRRKLKMPYNFHSLRHYGTSTIIANSKALGIDMLFVQHRGGWKNQETMMNVYNNVMQDYFTESDKKVIGLFDKFNNDFSE